MRKVFNRHQPFICRFIYLFLLLPPKGPSMSPSMQEIIHHFRSIHPCITIDISFICPSILPFTIPSLQPSIHISSQSTFHPSVIPSLHQFIHTSTFLFIISFIYQCPIYPFQFILLSNQQSINTSSNPSINLFIISSYHHFIHPTFISPSIY